VEGGLIGALILYGAPPGPAAGAVLLYRGISLSVPVLLSAGAWAPRRDGQPSGAGRPRRAIMLRGARGVNGAAPSGAAPAVAGTFGTD
jgi:hypothetical protein